MLANLKYDPLKFFDDSPSVYGVLARRRLKIKPLAQDQGISDQFVSRMKSTQRDDGSWRGATTDTVRALDILRSLNVSKSEKWITRGLEWLLAQHNGPSAYRQGFFALPESDDHIKSVALPSGEPLTSEASVRHIYGELALAVLLRYGERSQSQVQTALAAMQGLLVGRYSVNGFYCCGACTASIWQVLGQVAQATSPRIINEGMETLKQNREEDGTWRRFPFYFTLLSLSRLPYPGARREIRHAAERLRRNQRSDGGFGQTDREEKTYAAIAALSVL